MSHPTRREILGILSERVACPRDLAAAVGTTVDAASYHVKRLVRLDCAELVREEQAEGSGAVVHYYRATIRNTVPEDLWNDLAPGAAESYVHEIAGNMLRDFRRSDEAEMIGRDEHFILARTLHVFDDLGFDEALAIMEKARLDLLAIEQQSRTRLAEQGTEAIFASGWQGCFEVPPCR